VNAQEILAAARAKIEKPEHWTQGFFARDKDKKPAIPHGSTATCWCALGALRNVASHHHVIATPARRLAGDSLQLASRSYFNMSVGDFNDHPKTRHEDVLVLFDMAIERLSSK
jgi:hypothetical protein